MAPINKEEYFDAKNLLKNYKLSCTTWFSVPSFLDLLLKTNSANIFKYNKFKELYLEEKDFQLSL